MTLQLFIYTQHIASLDLFWSGLFQTITKWFIVSVMHILQGCWAWGRGRVQGWCVGLHNPRHLHNAWWLEILCRPVTPAFAHCISSFARWLVLNGAGTPACTCSRSTARMLHNVSSLEIIACAHCSAYNEHMSITVAGERTAASRCRGMLLECVNSCHFATMIAVDAVVLIGFGPAAEILLHHTQLHRTWHALHAQVQFPSEQSSHHLYNLLPFPSTTTPFVHLSFPHAVMQPHPSLGAVSHISPFHKLTLSLVIRGNAHNEMLANTKVCACS